MFLFDTAANAMQLEKSHQEEIDNVMLLDRYDNYLDLSKLSYKDLSENNF